VYKLETFPDLVHLKGRQLALCFNDVGFPQEANALLPWWGGYADMRGAKA